MAAGTGFHHGRIRDESRSQSSSSTVLWRDRRATTTMRAPVMKKGLRFDIFRRDAFTCRYCGAKPPSVVLEVDHVMPRAMGGTDDPLNLVTSCADCNRGKSAKLLDVGAIEQDADLEYLQLQQEMAEIRRYQEALIEREAATEGLVDLFHHLWCEIAGLDWSPSDAVIRSMLARYDREVVEAAIRDVAPKVAGGYLTERNDKWLGYMWAVARNIAEARE